MCVASTVSYNVRFLTMRDILKDRPIFVLCLSTHSCAQTLSFFPFLSALLYKRIDVGNKPDPLPRFKTASVGNLLKSLISDELIKASTVTPIGHERSHKVVSR